MNQPKQISFFFNWRSSVPEGGRSGGRAVSASSDEWRDLDEGSAVDRVRRRVSFAERPDLVAGRHAHARAATPAKL